MRAAIDKLRANDRLSATLVMVLAMISNWPLLRGQFDGEDEPLQAWSVEQIRQALGHPHFPGTLTDIGRVLSLEYHPPLRFVLSLPGWTVFPGTEFGLRLLAIIGSLALTWVVMAWGRDLAGRSGRVLAGIYVASSAVFNWTSMAFALSVLAVCVLGIFRTLREATLDLADPAEQRRLTLSYVLVGVGFLTNTGFVLFYAALFFLYLRANLRRPSMLVRLSVPHGLLVTAYYAYFLFFVSWLYSRLKGEWRPVGQLYQNLSRSAYVANLESLTANLQGLNAYFLPFVSWIVLVAGMLALWRRYRHLLWVITPYVMFWSFYARDDTQSYFILAVLPVLAAGCLALFAARPTDAPALARLRVWGFLFVVAAQLAWNWTIFMRPYTENDHPAERLHTVMARADRYHNVVHPYRDLARDLDRVLGPDGTFLSDLTGAFHLFYYRDTTKRIAHSKYAGAPDLLMVESPTGPCWTFSTPVAARALVSTRQVCSRHVAERITYPGSPIMLYRLTSSEARP